MKLKQDIHRTPKHERTELEQGFRDKAANSFRTSKKCDDTYTEALYYGQYIANKFAAISVRTSHRYGFLQDLQTSARVTLARAQRAEAACDYSTPSLEALEAVEGEASQAFTAYNKAYHGKP